MPQINIPMPVDKIRNDTQFQKIVLNINIKKSKVLLKCFWNFLFLSLIISMIVTTLLIHQLQAQMNFLISMYQDSNENNRVNSSNSSVNYNDPVRPVISSTLEFSNQMEVRNDKNSRITRQNFLRSETQYNTTLEDKTSHDHKLISQSELRMRRMRRDHKESEKGQNKIENKRQHIKDKDEKRRQSKKKKRQQKRQQNRRGRKHKRSRPLMATFIGQVPESVNAVIGRWMKSNANHQYDFTEFHLVNNNMEIEIGISGLYIISVQIFYVSNATNSYWLLLNSKGASTTRKLITCATAPSDMEVSCYTSLIIYLQERDRLSLQQVQKERLIKLKEGYSQIQIMLLDNDRRHTMVEDVQT
ncbi:uncharacterized protein LOC105199159 isoform X2 [Solenopsis invicta]|nr:uncharacterized protein LOC105199159 isoform X2 [Solenopsis invicta]